ncbi:hypothetical protein GTP58_28845 [Duganella sp. CY15W]|uniref:hypothetical protein n=1 Tax=Duganella sp. CY15W TaxID=2692172 RepID=UPI00136D2067|nr:hypothetical protein [Duganella sp. CY15W]MYM32346.1 hypothetical protein [Duganella sp. CY15W]
MSKNILGAVFFIVIAGCIGKPFQPGPPAFKMWEKNGVGEDGIKRDLFSCGYPNLNGFSGVDASLEEKAKAQQCMFKKGFKMVDGWVGICAEKNRRQPLSACGDDLSN